MKLSIFSWLFIVDGKGFLDCFLKIFIGVQLVYTVVLVSGVQQRESATYIYTYTQAWKPSSQHAGEKRGVARLLLGRTERAARAAELQLCAQAR